MRKTRFLLLSLVLLFCFIIPVKAAFPETIHTAAMEGYLSLNDSLEVIHQSGGFGDTAKYPWFPYKPSTDQVPLICLSGASIDYNPNTTCNLINWDNEGQSYAIAYIINTINSGSSDEYTKYYYKEVLIQYYLDTLTAREGSYFYNNVVNNEDVKIAGTGKSLKEIISGANNAANNTDTSSAVITVDGEKSANISFTLDEDGYYYSNIVTIESNTSVPSIALSNNKFKVSHDGNKYLFKIKATDIEPGELESFTTTVSVSKSYSISARYDCGSGYQKLALDRVDTVSNTDSITITGSVRREYSVISKISGVDGKELPGATLEILDSNKESISCFVEDSDGNLQVLEKCEWVSTDEPKSIFALPEGKYYLKEIISPEGYELKETLVEFEVQEGAVARPKMVNDLEVDVPNTMSEKSVLLIAIAMFDIALGIGIITYVKKNKVSE